MAVGSIPTTVNDKVPFPKQDSSVGVTVRTKSGGVVDARILEHIKNSSKNQCLNDLPEYVVDFCSMFNFFFTIFFDARSHQ